MQSNQRRNIVVIGASAGGVEAIEKLTSELPKDLRAAVFIVHHLPAYANTSLHEIITRKSGMTAVIAEDEQIIEEGMIYCGPPNRHMMLEDGKIYLSTGPKENRFRPSVDALFRSAAYIYGQRVIGIVLSGAMNDGSSGMCTIKRLKGITMTQSPSEAVFESMPMSVHHYIEVDYNLPAKELGLKLNSLVEQSVDNVENPPLEEAYINQLRMEIDIAKSKNALEMGVFENGSFTPLTCPDCEGALVRMPDEDVLRFRCHTGHAFTAESVLAGVTENIESDLYKTMRRMEEGTFILNRIGEQMEDFGIKDTQRFYAYADLLRGYSREVHDMIADTNILRSDKLARIGERMNLNEKNSET